jgi:predicted PurR-regulated permease PerM
VLALWIGAALGGVVGVCLAVPFVGLIKATHRHWREYRDIEVLVAEAAAARLAGTGGSPELTPPPA